MRTGEIKTESKEGRSPGLCLPGRVMAALLLPLLILVVSVQDAISVGYAPFAVYGFIDGDSKRSIYITAESEGSGVRIPMEVREEGGFYLATYTAKDTSGPLLIDVRVNYRGGTLKYMFEAALWEAAYLNISLPSPGDDEADSGASSYFSLSKDSSRGTVITPIVRDSEDSSIEPEDFKKRYAAHPEHPGRQKEPYQEKPAPAAEWAHEPVSELTAAALIFAGILLIILMLGLHLNSAKSRERK